MEDVQENLTGFKLPESFLDLVIRISKISDEAGS